MRRIDTVRRLTISLAVLGLLFLCVGHLWAQGPSLSQGAVDPTAGDVTTAFKYSVVYTNPAGAPPLMGFVVIDQRAHLRMTPQGSDWATGVTYEVATRLRPGEHTFRFAFLTRAGLLLFPGPTRAETLAGPTVAAPPLFIAGRVHTTGNRPLEGATVKALQGGSEVGSATTDAAGRYRIEGLAPGRYAVVAEKTDWRFLPRVHRVHVPPAKTGVHFLAFPNASGGLTDGKVDPDNGTVDTNFTYSVTYTNSLNLAPRLALVIIDPETDQEQAGLMVKDPVDDTFTDGCLYTYQTTLPVGEHTFRFLFLSPGQKWLFPGPTPREVVTGPTVISSGTE